MIATECPAAKLTVRAVVVERHCGMAAPSQFDETWYLDSNLDVAAAGVDPYEHFLQFGLSEGRTTASYNEASYLGRYADVAEAVADGHFASGWAHFVTFGDAEGRDGSGPVYKNGADTADALTAAGYPDGATLKGEDGADSLTGGTVGDLLYGNRNADLLIGGAGDDTLFGGQNDGPAGSDGVWREGVDTLSGGAGNDLVYGNHGADLLSGGDGADTLYGGQDADTLSGGAGDDTLFGNRGSDLLYGGNGDDLIDMRATDAGADSVYGGDGNDTIVGGNETVFGGAGSTVYGGDGVDILQPVLGGTAVHWEDFDPDEGDRISTVYIGQAATVIFNEDEGTVNFSNLARHTSVTVYIGRSDFSEDWLV